ncbi:hypothetical protein WJX81_001376 [Elliptochloris bilobata]|uniref:Major facilitator superfamily (MFS) profile domain-containing protein n=1 Tax=Elliptochloris bilobata TaxID=381761 RepID=A0AAW1S0Y5_9CHLO
MAPVKQVKSYEQDPDLPTKFSVPVDTEHKSKTIRLFSLCRPHMLAFHLNWLGFFITFLSAYAAAPLIPVIRDSIHLYQFEANLAGVVTTAGTVVARIAMGSICDFFGPRYAYGFLLCLTAPVVAGMALVTDHIGYIVERMLIGWSLAAFVICQFWSSMMFSPNVVGTANSIVGGWGNAGGGVTQIVMPYITVGIAKYQPETLAWRYAFLVPACCHVVIAFLILAFAQDLPDGQYNHLEKSGKKAKANPLRELAAGLTNYRMYGLAACYAYSFGLALDNALAPYFEKNFGFNITDAGNLAATFGMLNFVCRPAGGIMSDLMGRRYGMRGRIWVVFIGLALGGVSVSLMGVCHNSLGLTMFFLVLSALFLEGTCGSVYGVVPFVSRRSTGIVCGLVSAGGAIGGVMNQAIFFLNTPAHGAYVLQQYDSFKWMGCAIVFVACIGVAPLYFPMWGGLFCGPKPGVTEEDYYFSEYTPAEREQGLHLAASNFAFESRSMRGMKRLAADPMFPATGHTVAKPGAEIVKTPVEPKVANGNGAANGNV